MVYRMFALLVLGLALALVRQAPAQEKGIGKDTQTHEGTIISTAGNKLVMRTKAADGAKEGKEHTHMLAPTATVTCDGKACKLSDLKTGQRVRVTTSRTDQKTALRVEALDKEKTFPPTTGKLP